MNDNTCINVANNAPAVIHVHIHRLNDEEVQQMTDTLMSKRNDLVVTIDNITQNIVSLDEGVNNFVSQVNEIFQPFCKRVISITRSSKKCFSSKRWFDVKCKLL